MDRQDGVDRQVEVDRQAEVDRQVGADRRVEDGKQSIWVGSRAYSASIRTYVLFKMSVQKNRCSIYLRHGDDVIGFL